MSLASANELEKSRKELADEYERVQKKAFTNWINFHLIKAGQKVDDLYKDLRDGRKLLSLLEVLTGVKLPREKGKMRFHHLQHVGTALDFLQKERRIKLVNIRSEEIVDGNPKLILGLVWTLILHFQISDGIGLNSEDRPTSPQAISTKDLKNKLLEWAQQATEGYEDVNLTNFDKSWRDGMGFCAIINRHRPDLLNFDDCDVDTPLENLELAFSVAEKELDIVRIVDPEDVCVPKPDDKAVLTYVSFLHHAFPDMPPPHWKKKPKVSSEGYTSLYDATEAWIKAKTEQSKAREFPNTVEEMRAALESFESSVLKEMPGKKRDVSTLSELNDKLKGQKKINLPPEYEYSKLAESWSDLQSESADCKRAMEEELKRLEGLESLANQIVSECTKVESGVNDFEAKLSDFEENSMSMTPEEAASVSEEIRGQLETLQEGLSQQAPLVEQLKEGNYHSSEEVDKRVNALHSQLESLLPRLEKASSVVGEVQVVTALESKLEDLELWLVTSGKFSNNQSILAQIEDHKAFQHEQLSAAQERVAHVNRSTPPGLDDKVKEVNQRLEHIVKQTNDRLDGLEPIIQTIREFDLLIGPLENWCTITSEKYDQLQPLALTVEVLQKQKEEVAEIRQEIDRQKEGVEKAQDVAEQFFNDTEPVQSLADRYARRLKSREKVSEVLRIRDSEDLEEASISEQAEALQNQWSWLNSHADERARQIDYLIDKISEFDDQYIALRQFVDEGTQLCATEKPVGETASRVEEQMETCQEFRAKMSAKEPVEEAMLALGRAILAEPNTTSQNDALMNKLTSFIADWSYLQMDWQNWYDELHAHLQTSQDLSNQFDKFLSGMSLLEPLCSKLFPANLSMDSLQQKLHSLQTKFGNEVLSPYQEKRAVYEDFRSKVQLLPNKQLAEESFRKFEEIAKSIEGHRDELSDVVSAVDGWWDELQGCSQWLGETQHSLSQDKPLANSMPLLEDQEKSIKSVCEAVEGQHDGMERVVVCLSELASHKGLLHPAPVTTHRDQLKSQWDTLGNEVQERSDLCSTGREQLNSYADVSVPFNSWLKLAEEKGKDFSTLPRSKEELLKRQEEVREFHSDVSEHGEALDGVETKGCSFLSTAKAYQSILMSYRQSVDSEEGVKQPEWVVRADEDPVHLLTMPTFQEDQYENGIRVVKAYSGSLRKRYDAIQCSVTEFKSLVDEAVSRRAEFDASLDGMLERLDEIESKCAETEEQPLRVQERAEVVRSLEVDCMALEPQLQTIDSQYDLLTDLDEAGGVWEGEDEARIRKEGAESQHKALLDRLRGQREGLNAELSDARAFLGSFESCLTWLRETERKIQRDDPLKLEVRDLTTGLTHLKGVASDITGHKAAYETLCSKCQELIEREVQDSEEMRQNLDNMQQRWNAIQIVNDDIEVIEETIPKLETFNQSYSQLLSMTEDLLAKITACSVSAISSDGLEAKGQGLQELSSEVATLRTSFENLLKSCDLFDTPFDTTKVEADISSLKDKMHHCDKGIASKKGDLKTLGKKVVPMEDLFQKFRSWLKETGSQLASLSPPSIENPGRSRQMQQAKVLVENVETHREDLEAVEDSVSILSPLLDESDQAELKGRLDALTGEYDALKFSCELYPVERWLEDRTQQLGDMAPTGVTVSALQKQSTAVQDLQKSISSYQPRLDSLASAATQADLTSQQDPPASSKMAQVTACFDQLKVLSEEKLSLLSGYLPEVQRYESSRIAWESLLCGWEGTAGDLPLPGATPESIQDQIENIKALQLAISDHEPEFISLQRELVNISQGPTTEPAFYDRLSKDLQSSSGKDEPRPGQQTQEETLKDYQERLDALKRSLVSTGEGLASKLEQSSQFKGDMAGLLDWMDGVVGRMDELVIRDPKSLPIEEQCSKCKEMLEALSSHQNTKDGLVPLFTQLTSELSDGSDETTQLQNQLDQLNTKWSNLTDQLRQYQSNLDTALPLAKSHEGAMSRLVPWVPNTLERLENLGPPPAEPNLVEQLKTEVENLKTEYNTLAPVYSSCVEGGQSLSSMCQEGEPKKDMDTGIQDLQVQWDQLNSQFGDILQKLNDALVQTQEFQGIANGLDRWMDTMGSTLRQQKRIAARVKLIEPQVEGFRHILSDIAAYSATVEQAKGIGRSLVDDSKPEESQKVTGRLEALTTQFRQLESVAQTRMARLEAALKCAAAYENEGSEFNRWLVDAEGRLGSLEQLAIASQPLKQQLEDVKSFSQDVEAHTPDMGRVTKTEEDLFDTELPTIQLCEEHLSKANEERKLVLPDWLERPGAPEAVEVGVDLRDRFDGLQASLSDRLDQATQCLASVLAYEADCDKFSEWLSREVESIGSLPAPALTVEELNDQLAQLENIQRDFKNREDSLESLDALGTSLIESCKSELSASSARIKLSDINEMWGDSLAALNSREEGLKKALVLAQTYQALHDSFDEWVTDCETKVAQPLKLDGDPKALKKQLQQLKALEENIAEAKLELKKLVDAGHKLEACTGTQPSSLPDIGYIALEDRYLALKMKVGERCSKIEEALGQASDLRAQLDDLLKQLEKLKTQLAAHKPPRVQCTHLERQIQDLNGTEAVFTGLQPKLVEAKQEGAAFASMDTSATPPPEGVPSGANIQELLTDLDRAEDKVDGLLKHWRDLLANNLQTANDFQQHHKELLDWAAEREVEMGGAEPVRGVPEGAEEQLQQIESIQTELNQQKAKQDSVDALGQLLTSKCSAEDAAFVKDKLSELKSGLDRVQRGVDVRRRVIEDGLASALAFLEAWNDTMAAIADKRGELEGLGDVGGDIDTVKAQLEEYKEFEASLSEIKPRVTKALELGKQLKENCSSIDGPHISEQLDQLNSAWSQLNSDSLTRKHSLEDGLLQLGQFQDALGELLAWILDSTAKLSNAPLPGVKVGSVETQLRDLQAIESGIGSHAPSVASLNSAGEKLGTPSNNAADIQQDLDNLNSKWDELKGLAASRSTALQEALPQAQSFEDRWKKELSWLTEAEARTYADWRPCGLPLTCQEDFDKHNEFTNEVESHQEPISQLKAEGDALKGQGNQEDQRVVDRWLGDILKRYEDLTFSLDEREAQMSYATERAGEFDQLYCDLRDKVGAHEESAEQQGNIRSEVEAVKEQMEEHKEFMRVLGELEGRLEELDGWGQLLTKDCVKADGQVIEDRVDELKSKLEALISGGNDRQASLEESLLSLGEFEEAYDELWAWLAEVLRQLEEAEPITGDPDAVSALLSRHKTLQKQLGARLASKNAVSRAGKLLMKTKTGEDKAVLKKKLADLDREWDKACSVSVDRQDKLENAYQELAEFRSYVGPLRSWTSKVLPTLDDSEPVHGDLHTVDSLLAAHEVVQQDLGAYQESMDEANAIGGHLIAEVLDEPSVTQTDLSELNEAWGNVCQRSVAKQGRLEEAYRAAEAFEDEYENLLKWIDDEAAQLQALPPPDDDSTTLQQQIDEHKERSQNVTSRQPDFDQVLGDGQNLLAVAHPKAVPILQSKLQRLERKWMELRGHIGARSEALASALLDLHGLQDMLDKLWGWVSEAEATIKETELVPIENNLEAVEQQLTDHEAFQEDMATQQPNMDALNKAAKKRKASHPNANPEMTKKISSLYKRWQKLWLRSSERHRQLLEAKTRLNDIALARSFDFDKWRKRFNTWVDQQKLRVSDLFHRFDSNHDGMLTREEFKKALKASGLAMTQIELEKIADSFDKGRSGMIDLSAILGVLKGRTQRRPRPLSQETLTDDAKIENEIMRQVSKCTCTKKFLVTRVSEGKYRFGNTQKLQLVRILRSTVMVRVGGGWQPLEEFLLKYDPCRTTGRTNDSLRGLLTAAPGLATTGFRTKQSSQLATKNEALRQGAADKGSTHTYPHGRQETTIATKKTARSSHSRDTTPTRETKPKQAVSGRSTPLGQSLGVGDALSSKRTTATKVQSSQPRPTTPSSEKKVVRSTTPSSEKKVVRSTTPSSSRTTSIRPTTPSSTRPTSVKTSPRRASSTLTSTAASKKTSPSPKHIRPTTPTSTSGRSVGAQKGSRIPTPKSKLPTKTS